MASPTEILTPHLLKYTLDITFPWPLSEPLDGIIVGQRMFGDYDAYPDWHTEEVKNALVALSELHDINGYHLLDTLLPPDQEKLQLVDYERVVGLVLLLDQGSRYVCTQGANVRYIYHFFGVLADTISKILLQEGRATILNLNSWADVGISLDHAILRALMLLAPLIHSDHPDDVQMALDATEELRVQYERRTGTQDPHRATKQDDVRDEFLMAALLKAGPPRDENVGIEDFVYWIMRYYTSHIAYVTRFGRSPIRNIGVGRADGVGEVEWLRKMGITRNAEDERIREHIKGDIQRDKWTPLAL